MAHSVIHISEADAEKDFGSVLARVREGAEVVIDGEAGGPAIAVVRPAKERPGRLLSESIAMAEARGSNVTLDEGFSHDLEESN